MNKKFILAAAAALVGVAVSAQESKGSIKWYGFIRNYAAVDSRESVSGTDNLFYYLPKDVKIVDGEDVNAVPSARFAALTSRLGVDVTGYEFQGWKLGAKIEADFYNGLSGSTGTAVFRLRQAYATIAKDALSFKVGQAWHPLAADMPDVFSLNTGAPLNPLSRTPLALMDYKFAKNLSFTAAALWQMQYTSAGPSGASADYIKYSCIPEFYFGLNYSADGFVGRVGLDVLSIKPRTVDAASGKKVSDRITTVTPFVYAQYSKDLLTLKAKATFAQAGEHMNLNGGYGVSEINADGSWSYAPTRNLSAWFSAKYGKKLQGVFFAGYAKNYGTATEILGPDFLYFSKNSFSNMNQMYRVTPTVMYNFGKLTLGLEYELTSVQYGSWGDNARFGLADVDLHWVTNHRVQAMLKFTF